ncbi:hypothetical protein ASD76_14010 [Altererythrobacter sp. Root672]|nr:hypothetical protein ASD76_14010 [Altererythrobacter sp. Root672]
MLTWTDLEALVQDGHLILWDPRKHGKVLPNGRALYMVPAVFDAILNGPWPGTMPGDRLSLARERKMAMRQVLERYVIGGHLNLERDIAELGSKILRPEHRGFWQFRSQGPWVETRLFGFFARPGAFVATDFAARDAVGDYRVRYSSSSATWAALAGSIPFMMGPYPVETPEHLQSYLDRDDDA